MLLKANKIVVWGMKKEAVDVISNAVIGELKCTQKIEMLPGPNYCKCDVVSELTL